MTKVPESIKVKLSIGKRLARKLGRVARWEKASENTNIELGGKEFPVSKR